MRIICYKCGDNFEPSVPVRRRWKQGKTCYCPKCLADDRRNVKHWYKANRALGSSMMFPVRRK